MNIGALKRTKAHTLVLGLTTKLEISTVVRSDSSRQILRFTCCPWSMHPEQVFPVNYVQTEFCVGYIHVLHTFTKTVSF